MLGVRAAFAVWDKTDMLGTQHSCVWGAVWWDSRVTCEMETCTEGQEGRKGTRTPSAFSFTSERVVLLEPSLEGLDSSAGH